MAKQWVMQPGQRLSAWVSVRLCRYAAFVETVERKAETALAAPWSCSGLWLRYYGPRQMRLIYKDGTNND